MLRRFALPVAVLFWFVAALCALVTLAALAAGSWWALLDLGMTVWIADSARTMTHEWQAERRKR